MNIAYVVICIIACAAIFGDSATALGRVVAFVMWLLVSALFLATAHADNSPTPTTYYSLLFAPYYSTGAKIPSTAKERFEGMIEGERRAVEAHGQVSEFLVFRDPLNNDNWIAERCVFRSARDASRVWLRVDGR